MEITFTLNDKQSEAVKEVLESPLLQSKVKDVNLLAKGIFMNEIIKAKQWIVELELGEVNDAKGNGTQT